MVEYVVEYLYRFIRDPIIPSDTRRPDIQFRTQMERMVVGREFRNHIVPPIDGGTIWVDMVLHGSTCAYRMVSGVQFRDTAHIDRTGWLRRTGMERCCMVGVRL